MRSLVATLCRDDIIANFVISNVREKSLKTIVMVNIHQYWVYIMSNKTRTVLYVGITNDLYRRYAEHKEEKIKGFTQKYKCHDLLYFEEFKDIEDAISREKEIKAWRREKKENLIATRNPEKRDLVIELEWI